MSIHYLNDCAKDRWGNPLVCTGCAHSAAVADFPGRPSGERPCCFCIRNTTLTAMSEEEKKNLPAVWYDGSKPVSVPMDCYHSLDMKKQQIEWFDDSSQEPQKCFNCSIELTCPVCD